ncbi:MAG: hypothetical protein SGI84_14495 [Gemmatimonadota bacterium]|nr:hypothetical protein [Gemmatimonadota bacterium]
MPPVFLILLLVLLGCGSQDSVVAAVFGTATPILDIGGDGPDGMPVLLAVNGAARVGTTLVVSDPSAQVIRFFDAEGRQVRMVGRQGNGPGEFQMISWLGACGGDSIYVVDIRQDRVTVLGPEGEFARQFTPLSNRAFQWVCSRQGGMIGIMGPRIFRTPANGYGRSPPDTAAVVRIGARGDTATVIPAVQIGEQRSMGLLTHVALTEERIWVGTGESEYLIGHSLDGAPRESLAVGTTRRKMTRPEYERGVDLLLATIPGSDPLRPMMLEFPMPEYFPHFGSIHAAPDGTIWIVTSMMTDSVTTLRALARDGRRIGDLRLPHQVTIYEVGNDYFVASHEAADGQPHVVVYAVRWGRDP